MGELVVFSRNEIEEFIQKLSFMDIAEDSLGFFESCVKHFNMDGSSLEEKLLCYYRIWKNTLNNLYEEECGERKRIERLGMEFTPFTVCLSAFGCEQLQSLYKLSEDERAYCQKIFDDKAKEYSFLASQENQCYFMFFILIAPPFVALEDFFNSMYNEHIQKASAIINIVQNERIVFPKYKCNLGLRLSSQFINQKIYEKYGEMEGLLSHDKFRSIRDELNEIKEECVDSAVLPKMAICPHCGKRHDITVRKSIIFYAHLTMLHKEVLTKLGLILMDEYRNMFSETFLEVFNTDFYDINQVKGAECFILVEGETEEKAIPAMAIKYGKPLKSKKIKIWNSRSKQQLRMDFEKLYSNMPEVKVCVLLDGDAVREIDRISKMIEEKKDRYSLHYIEDGTFEDIIDKEIAVNVLNQIYGENVFRCEDFENGKSFLYNVKRKLHADSSLGDFDKVEFIKKVLRDTTKENVPAIIKNIIDDAYNLIGLN